VGATTAGAEGGAGAGAGRGARARAGAAEVVLVAVSVAVVEARAVLPEGVRARALLLRGAGGGAEGAAETGAETRAGRREAARDGRLEEASVVLVASTGAGAEIGATEPNRADLRIPGAGMAAAPEGASAVTCRIVDVMMGSAATPSEEDETGAGAEAVREARGRPIFIGVRDAEGAAATGGASAMAGPEVVLEVTGAEEEAPDTTGDRTREAEPAASSLATSTAEPSRAGAAVVVVVDREANRRLNPALYRSFGIPPAASSQLGSVGHTFRFRFSGGEGYLAAKASARALHSRLVAGEGARKNW